MDMEILISWYIYTWWKIIPVSCIIPLHLKNRSVSNFVRWCCGEKFIFQGNFGLFIVNSAKDVDLVFQGLQNQDWVQLMYAAH